MMPVAEDFYRVDPKAVKRLESNIPSRIKEEQFIPTDKEKSNIEKYLLYHGLWLVLTYGADLLSMVVPWLGKAFGQLVRWKFKGKWEQKQIGL